MFSYPVAWTRVTWLTYLLAPLAGLFLAAVSLRRLLYQTHIVRSERMPVPVIVVGNISVGGTGKTPLVLWLATRLRAAGYRPGIISRGYGGTARGPQAVLKDSDAAHAGDEPVLLARRSGCAVWIGRNRPAAARALIHANPECNVIISDDGLQHYRLARDVEIAVIDAARGHGNGWMLPAGPLREPPSRLSSVDAVVVRGGANAPRLSDAPPYYGMTLACTGLCNLRHASRREAPGHFKGLRVHAVAGIGNPQQFFDTLTHLGIAHTAHAFADHHPYSAQDLAFGDCDAIVMTEKDAVKCARYATERHWVLPVEADIDDALARAVLAQIKGKH
jgi:tetraacyldisaccharide 4'-kinase